MANQHVTPDGQGGWKVQGAGNSRATQHFNTQAEAITRGRQIAQNQQSELFVHGRNGQIRERNTYGNDPYPPKG
ncbi:DUF2188 domain-containing protein [Weissella confusa]|uniref:DUF2188 domain-containing protein n=1 Tax=Weissella confusa TaxID=1583 RepID=UPI001C6F7D52|nr:DUF2188 domain-containing protein [Weissella confusa]QYU58174.1 DUF2188 domain-containing protein [Weissella confusa]